MGDEPNGTLRWRIEQLEKGLETRDEAFKLLAEFGAKHNEQLRDQERRIEAQEKATEGLPVVKTELVNLKESWRAARNAGYAVAGALVSLMGTIIWQALQG